MSPKRIPQVLAFVVGLLDLLSGLGLVFAPSLTLRLMWIAVPGSEAVDYVRFVGAFVLAIGASYLWALARPEERLRVVFGMTLLPRLSVGLFTAYMVLAGRLGTAWLIVSAADLGLVVVQNLLLRRREYWE